MTIHACVLAQERVYGESPANLGGGGTTTIKTQAPLGGYELGCWSPEEDEQANMAVRGDYKLVGDILAKQRSKTGREPPI